MFHTCITLTKLLSWSLFLCMPIEAVLGATSCLFFPFNLLPILLNVDVYIQFNLRSHGNSKHKNLTIPQLALVSHNTEMD